MYAISLAAIGVVQYMMSYHVLDAQPAAAPDITSILHQIQQSVVSTCQILLQAVDDTMMSLARVAFVTLLVLGFFLYSTHLHRRLGKDLMFGGVTLAIIFQFMLPLISRV